MERGATQNSMRGKTTLIFTHTYLMDDPNLNFATGKSKVQTLRANGFHQSRGSDRGLLRPSWPLSHQRGLHLLQAEVHAIKRLGAADRDAGHHPLVTTMVSQRRQQRSLTENTLNSCSRWVSILKYQKKGIK